MTITVSLPDALYKRTNDLLHRSNAQFEDFIATALEHEITRQETERFFAEKTDGFDVKTFRELMAKIPAVPPEAKDRL